MASTLKIKKATLKEKNFSVKAIAVLAAAFVIIILSMCIVDWQMHNSSRTMVEKATLLQLDITEENWGKAGNSYNLLQSDWDKNKRWWMVFQPHDEIDSIEFSLSQLRENVKNRNFEDSSAETSKLITMISHIPEKERLRFENIF